MPPRVALAVPVGLLAGAAASCGGQARAQPAGPRFVERGAEAGLDGVVVCGDPRRWYIPESQGSGAAWLDVDGDGDLDLFVGNGARVGYVDDGRRLDVRPERSRLYRNEGGLRFTDASAETGADVAAWVNAVTVADVEGDGDPDVYLACFGRDVLLVNEGGRLVDRTRELGLGNALWGAGAAFADVDRDGDLDLYVANYCLFDPEAPPDGGRRQVYEGVEVGWGPEEENGRGFNRGAPDVFYRNEGGRFVEATAEAGLALERGLCSYAAVFSDVDGDGWPDLLVANDLQPCNLFVNRGDGTFADEAVERGFAFGAEGRPTAAMGLLVADVDADGDPDVLRTNFDLEPNALHVNDGTGRFVDRAEELGLARPSLDRLGWGGGFLDVDLDGDLDLLVANGHVLPQAPRIGMSAYEQASQLYEAQRDADGGVTWREVDAGPGLALPRSARGVALGDPDDDGDLDAVIVDLDHRPRLLVNETPRRGRWLRVRCVGRGANRDALGAVVRVVAGGRAWTREVRAVDGLYSTHDPRLHFGLGPVERVERVEVRWPSGASTTVPSPALETTVEVVEPAAPTTIER